MEKLWIWAILVVVAFSTKCESAASTSGEIDYNAQRDYDYDNDAEVATTTAAAKSEETVIEDDNADAPVATEQTVTKVYHVYTEFTANWYRAYHYCVQNNMQLATIDTQVELDLIRKQIGETKFSDNFWIGMTKLGHQSLYWFGHKKPDAFALPIAEEECGDCKCVSVSEDDENFIVGSCKELNYFVCESGLSE